MRPTKTLIVLATMIAITGTAAAEGGTLDASATTDHGAAGVQSLVDKDARYADLDAYGATEHASAALDTDANVADLDAARSGSFFGWLEVRFDAVIAKLATVFSALGQDQPETGGGVETYVSTDGVDLDANVAGVDFDSSPAGDLDGKTFEAAALAKGKVEDAKSRVPSLQ